MAHRLRVDGYAGPPVVIHDALWTDLCAILGLAPGIGRVYPHRLVDGFSASGVVARDVHPDLDLLVDAALRGESVIAVDIIEDP